MSKQRDLKHRQHNLMEVREIMNSMKSLAYMETHKLENFLPPQQAMVANINTVAYDFMHAYPQFLSHSDNDSTTIDDPLTEVLLVVGSERSFCADFNQRLIEDYMQFTAKASRPITTMAIGSRLIATMREHRIDCIAFDGASVCEEIESVMLAVVDNILTLQQLPGKLTIPTIYHGTVGEIVKQALLPPFQEAPAEKPSHQIEPLLYLDKERFLVHLSSHYIYIKILEILYLSLMSENQLRVSHLQSALNRLDESLEQMQKRINAQRQEEITEEIEVIMLGSN